MDLYSNLTHLIIQRQEAIIGPLAIEQARKVKGLSIDESGKNFQFSGDQKNIVENLVEKYAELFGKASVEVCKEATKGVLSNVPRDQIPPILQ